MQMKQARTEANSRAQPKNHQIDEDESKKDDGAPLKRGRDGGDHRERLWLVLDYAISRRCREGGIEEHQVSEREMWSDTKDMSGNRQSRMTDK